MMAPNHSVSLSVVIPVYNEVDNVEALYQEIVGVLANVCELEVIFVDDGSQDGTGIFLQDLAKKYPHLKAISHKKNYGQSAALLTGVKAASHQYIVTMDGDGQNDPTDIPKFLAQFTGDKTVVLGHRKKRDDNRLRRISSRVGNGVRRWLLDDNCHDTGCSLKLFSRDAFLLLPHFNHMHRFLPALFKRAGYNLVNIEVNHRARRYGVSKYGVMNRLFVGIYDLFGMCWLLKRPCAPEINHDEC